MTQFSFSTADKLKEIEREIAMRKRFYPTMIVKGSLTAAAAEERIAILQAIAADYRKLEEPALI